MEGKKGREEAEKRVRSRATLCKGTRRGSGVLFYPPFFCFLSSVLVRVAANSGECEWSGGEGGPCSSLIGIGTTEGKALAHSFAKSCSLFVSYKRS